MKQTPISQIINLKNKTAVVTGGAMGIGKGIVYRLAESGANVVIADINKETGEKTAKELDSEGLNVAFVKTDASKEEDVKKAVSFCLNKYKTLDILVNNAGIYPIIPVMQMETKDFEKIIDINLKSTFLFTKAAGQVMIEQGKGGKIINITSIDALHPSSVGLAVYDASKHGMWGFTKNAALELAPYNIQVNAIAPGSIATPGTGAGKPASAELQKIIGKFIKKIPMKRMGEADEIGKVALFLASDMSSYMTGSQIVVDGGVLLS